MKYRKLLSVILLSGLLTVIFPTGICAAEDESDIPTIYCNDEAWYRASITPVLYKGGVLHIPVEVTEMFVSLTVTENSRNEACLLFTYGEDEYLSVIFDSSAAYLNGVIYENVSIFRDNGSYYIDAQFICDALGLTLETKDDMIRVSDVNASKTFDEVIELYTADNENNDYAPDEVQEPDEAEAKIYIFCQDTEYNVCKASEFASQSGLKYTLLLNEFSSEQTMMEFFGRNAVMNPYSEESLDSLSQQVRLITGTLPHLVFSYDDTDAGTDGKYIYITADYIIDNSTDSDVVFNEVRSRIDSGESVTVLLEDTWQAQRFTLLVQQYGYGIYTSVIE